MLTESSLPILTPSTPLEALPSIVDQLTAFNLSELEAFLAGDPDFATIPPATLARRLAEFEPKLREANTAYVRAAWLELHRSHGTQ